jgi:hypothetical protein
MSEQDKVGATVDEMERALSSVVDEIVKLKDQHSPSQNADERRDARERTGPAPTQFKSALDLITRSPVEGALRLVVRDIGDGLFAVLQNPQKMMRVARNVCNQDEINWSKRMTIIDAAWAGIGSDANGYWG